MPSVRPRFHARLWAVLFRWAAVFALFFAVPSVHEAVVDAVDLAAGISCCEDRACDDEAGHAGSEEGCPSSCMHGCCAHPVALPPAPLFVLLTPSHDEVAYAWPQDAPLAEGHQTPPFRPPAA